MKQSYLVLDGDAPWKLMDAQIKAGRTPPILRDFEPLSETMSDDLSGGVPGCSRHHMRVAKSRCSSWLSRPRGLA